MPLAVQLTAANVHDSKLLEPLVDAVRPIRRPTGEPGRPRKRPAKLHADKAYASRANRVMSRLQEALASAPDDDAVPDLGRFHDQAVPEPGHCAGVEGVCVHTAGRAFESASPQRFE